MKALASIVKLSHRKFVAIAVATGVAASGTLVWSASNAAFTAQTANPSNTWTTAAIGLTDDDSSTAMFTLTNLVPGATDYRCITVTYTGNAAVAPVVKVYASALTDTPVGPIVGGVPGTGTSTLGAYIKLKIEESATGVGPGTFSGTDNTGCVGWASTSVLLNDAAGTAANFRSTNSAYASGLGTWAAATGTRRMYKVTYTLDTAVPPGNAAGETAGGYTTAQGKTCVLAITWEAQAGS
jgi:hypothetical protein